ncbi:MAG: 50S ribosomal protein L3 [Candidatus Liptonbacteria bacterium]
MFILGKKVKMSQLWKGEKVVPVTIIKAEPNTVALLRAKEKDGYDAVQLKSGRAAREFRVKSGAGAPVAEIPAMEKGSTVDVTVFNEGDTVRVTGVSKGKGFQGVVKRHGFHGGPKTHGQKNRHRAPGSLGATAPQRVVPGRKMAGRTGGDQVTLTNVKVVSVNKEDNTILIRGAVPGARGGLLKIQKVSAPKKSSKK